MIQSNIHAPFRLSNLSELRDAVRRLGLDISIEEDTSYLARSVSVADRVIPNSMCIQPMEGCDGTANGAPDTLTFRRYRRFAAGGAGLLWFEACAVAPEGRANPRQIWLHRDTKDDFARLLDESRGAAVESMGDKHTPFAVLQLTHSGRYSRPVDAPAPILAFHDPLLDADRGIPADYPVISDDELETLEDAYVTAAKLAFEVGFDAVDVKSCHRYLLNELLAAHARKGNYGGSYENRTRFLKNVVGKIFAQVGADKIVTCRLGIHDAHPYPCGWGMDKDDPTRPSLDEPKRLVRELYELGMPIIDITMGNPYFNPHVNRPYDRPVEGGDYPHEHPLAGVARLVSLTREIQRHVPGIVVVGSGYSWLRNLWPYVAAANIRDAGMRIVGVGRQAFAYPEFAKEILETGKLERRHTCITCSSCTQIMRDGGRAGCVPFDSEVYGPIYREGRRSSLDYVKAQAARCRDCFDPTCKDGCPANVDIPGFISALAEGDVRRSYEILRERNVLPELCAYVCPAEVQCEGSCIEKVFSQNPVSIRELQRYVSRVAREKGWARLPSRARPSGKRVAVIGAGPAGLACASRLLALGHAADLFDLREELGGVAVSAIPAGRLHPRAVEAEVAAVFSGLKGDSFTFHGGEGLSESKTLEDFAARCDAVFLAVGLGRCTPLSEPRPHGVEDAISFLERAKREGVVVPSRVAVLGGGNTAMDAATTALSLGARDVYVVYRRSFAEMPAWPADRDEALDMGVHLLMLTQPVGYEVSSDGRVIGVRAARTVLGEPDATGRRRPIVVPNSESVLEVEMVLEALGQELPEELESLIPGVELSSERLIKVDERSRTSREGVFAGGDVVNGGTTAVQATAEGMRAAEAIDDYLRGKPQPGS